jgi:predicted transcriptional regulator
MAAISLRLPDDVEAKLSAEAAAEGKSRSEVARDAIVAYLERREKERFMRNLAEGLRELYSNPEARREALELANDLADEGLDRIIEEERAAGIDPDEKWWE